MDKNDIKNFLMQTEKMVKEVGAKASELAKAVEKDATYGPKAGMIKVEQLALENDKNKIINQFGKKAHWLMKRKLIKHKSLDELFAKIEEIESKVKVKKTELSKLKRERTQKSEK